MLLNSWTLSDPTTYWFSPAFLRTHVVVFFFNLNKDDRLYFSFNICWKTSFPQARINMKWKDELRSTCVRADSLAFSANKHKNSCSMDR